VTTPSASSGAYITREQAAELFDGTPEHIYQGDVFHSIELVVPRVGGMLDPVQGPLMVISHDCEYTKIANNPTKPLLVAPLRALSVFSQREEILEGKTFGLWALPREEPLDDEYAVDFRLTQPIAVSELRIEYHWTCLSPEAKETLHAHLAKFFLRREPKAGSEPESET
jgi:hypothetical protein